MKLLVISICFSIVLGPLMLSAQPQVQTLRDFRGTPQKLSLIGAFTEFVEPELKERILQDTRRALNKYTRSYGAASIAAFKMGQNPNDLYFQPVQNSIEEDQKKYLNDLAKENSIDIIALSSIREVGDEFEMEIQLYDSRIEELSAIETTRFPYTSSKRALKVLAYRIMNYLDKEGYVQDTPQNFLTAPQEFQSAQQAQVLRDSGEDAFAVSPADLGGGYLAGGQTVGGEKTPFWERWWFWTLIGGGIVVGGGLTYYFLVVNQPPSKADIKFGLP
jgi:hypothetical protein